jgi:hypothetical protein
MRRISPHRHLLDEDPSLIEGREVEVQVAFCFINAGRCPQPPAGFSESSPPMIRKNLTYH